MSSTSKGIIGQGAPHSYDAQSVMVIVCSTLALYNSLELLGLIFMTFKRRSGLYFWSISLASFGIIPYCIGWLIVRFNLTHAWAGMIIDSIGWVLLVSGQSVVLYSRLHLVLNDERILRAVLWMIITNGFIWHPSITVLLFGSSYGSESARRNFNSVFNILEKVQMTCFCLQEFTISGLYIWQTLDILRTAFGNKRRFMWQLFAINVIIVDIDIGLLAIEYRSLFVWNQGVKVVTYSIKLKLEFGVLGELVEFVKSRGGNGSGDPTDRNTAGFVELSVRTQQANRSSGSAKRAQTIHLENVKPKTSVSMTSCNRFSNPQREHQGIRPMTRIDVEHHDDETAEQLYDSAIQEISRAK